MPFCAEVLPFHFLPFTSVRRIFQRLTLHLTNSLDGSLLFHRTVGGWLLENLYLTTPFIGPPNYRFPVSIRRAWFQEMGVGMELLKRKLGICLPLATWNKSQASVLKQLLAFSVANSSKCFTKGIACRCGYDNLQSMT